MYDPEQFRLVQTNEGHTDAVRSIIHVAERNQVSRIDGLVQDCSNSIANALELLQSCTKPSI